MLLSKERLLYLLNAWSGNKAAEAEEQELLDWVNESDNHELLFKYIQTLTAAPDSEQQLNPVDWDHLYEQILDESAIQKKPSLIRRMPWFRWSAAAVIIVLFGGGLYLYLYEPPLHIAAVKTISASSVTDVPAPVKNKAVLTLADGSKIQLDSFDNGTLARQGTVQVIKKADGEIIYNGTGTEVLYNLLNVPRGSRVVTITLSDGTKVWLNSESSLRYPASFTGAERKVEITGEAYFEVAHNAAMPFVVKKDDLEVKVLGTHFNINAYADEKMSRVTLLEGSVKISTASKLDILKPGQQAQVSKTIKLVSGVNIEEVMAWKNGLFQFGETADLQLIMRKIARWYDVEVDYEGGTENQRFGGEIPMNSNLSDVLEILRTSGVKFTIEGNKVIVKP